MNRIHRALRLALITVVTAVAVATAVGPLAGSALANDHDTPPIPPRTVLANDHDTPPVADR